MASTVRVIEEGPAGEVLLQVNVAPFITLDTEGVLTLTEHPGAIRIDEEGRFYYTIPYDIVSYGRLASHATYNRSRRRV